jgi:hypothetical protein
VQSGLLGLLEESGHGRITLRARGVGVGAGVGVGVGTGAGAAGGVLLPQLVSADSDTATATSESAIFLIRGTSKARSSSMGLQRSTTTVQHDPVWAQTVYVPPV